MSNTKHSVALVTMLDGSVQGHDANCGDLARAVRGQFAATWSDEPWVLEVETKHDAFEAYNADFLAEEPDGSSSYEIRWLPCADHVPATAGDESSVEVRTVSVRGVEFKACNCNCGQPVGKRSDYRPGHDARHAGRVGRDAAIAYFDGQGAVDSVEFYFELDGRPLLKAKALRVAQGVVAKHNRKVIKAGHKPSSQTGEIKVGRWTYPVRMTSAGKAQRNEKRDGSGAWIAVNPNAASNIDWS